jgi:hypothetical protein
MDMVGSKIFQAVVIGVLSTGLYIVFTKDNPRYDRQDRHHEYFCIGTIVTVVSTMLLLMMDNSNTLVIKENISSSFNHKPPF